MRKSKQKIEKESAQSGLFSKIRRRISDGIYGLEVKLHSKLPHKQKTGKQKRLGEQIFYWAILLLPLIQFSVMYIAVNINSFLLAFKSYTVNSDGSYTIEWVGFNNFRLFFNEVMEQERMKERFSYSFLVYGINLIAGTALSILFSYYIYKEFRATGLFRTVLMIPSIISSVVFVLVFKYFTEIAVPEMFDTGGLISSGTPLQSLFVIMICSILASFGSNVLMYSNAMSRIPVSLVEYAKLEGCSPLREFVSITLPLSYPTIETFLIIGLANVFINQGELYTFFGARAPIETIGYYLFMRVESSTATMTSFPYAAAVGLTLTAVTIPVVMVARFFLDKLDKGVEF